MNFYSASFFSFLRQSSLGSFTDELESKNFEKLKNPGQGDFEKWEAAFAELPNLQASSTVLNQDIVTIVSPADYVSQGSLRKNLMQFHPWRKGPFKILGIEIDTEWKSYLKWNRIRQKMSPLKDRAILDLGCGNGYYLWRMLGEGARIALGVDPSWLYFFQFQTAQKYIQDHRASVLPLGVEDLPAGLTGFDTVFSMGLLYHRRDPLEHLNCLKQFLRPGGQAIVETLVIPGERNEVLKPKERYAKMRNVWNVPSCPAAEAWLAEAGFQNIVCADVSVTTFQEQRKTKWMTFESLEDFLDPKDLTKTVEGYPAPQRAVFIAEKK